MLCWKSITDCQKIYLLSLASTPFSSLSLSSFFRRGKERARNWIVWHKRLHLTQHLTLDVFHLNFLTKQVTYCNMNFEFDVFNIMILSDTVNELIWHEWHDKFHCVLKGKWWCNVQGACVFLFMYDNSFS